MLHEELRRPDADIICLQVSISLETQKNQIHALLRITGSRQIGIFGALLRIDGIQSHLLLWPSEKARLSDRVSVPNVLKNG